MHEHRTWNKYFIAIKQKQNILTDESMLLGIYRKQRNNQYNQQAMSWLFRIPCDQAQSFEN